MINTGETNTHTFDHSATTALTGILSFGSKFNLKLFKPDGTLFAEKRSSTSQITFSVPRADSGMPTLTRLIKTIMEKGIPVMPSASP
jgi:hypothetical protein